MRRLVLGVAIAMVLSACGNGSDPQQSPSSSASDGTTTTVAAAVPLSERLPGFFAQALVENGFGQDQVDCLLPLLDWSPIVEASLQHNDPNGPWSFIQVYGEPCLSAEQLEQMAMDEERPTLVLARLSELVNAAMADLPPDPLISSVVIDELSDPFPIIEADFTNGLGEGWFEQIWMKPADGGGEVTVDQGVRFIGLGDSTRAGVMTVVDASVEGSAHVVIEIRGLVLEQGLAGTGWNGREAPLALTVTYLDANGTEHLLLSEDPAEAANMFYRGFTIIPRADMVNGVKVTAGEPFEFSFDLMNLDPKPIRILGVGVEGGGWQPRVGVVYWVRMTAGN